VYCGEGLLLKQASSQPFAFVHQADCIGLIVKADLLAHAGTEGGGGEFRMANNEFRMANFEFWTWQVGDGGGARLIIEY